MTTFNKESLLSNDVKKEDEDVIIENTLQLNEHRSACGLEGKIPRSNKCTHLPETVQWFGIFEVGPDMTTVSYYSIFPVYLGPYRCIHRLHFPELLELIVHDTTVQRVTVSNLCLQFFFWIRWLNLIKIESCMRDCGK